jgi:transglutaminase-like putative cysteine protease
VKLVVTPFTVVLALALPACARGPARTQDTVAPTLSYDLRWKIQVDSIPAGTREAVIWVALPQERPEQRVTDLRIRSDRSYSFVTDPDFENRVARFTISNPPESWSAELSATVERAPVGPRTASLTEDERKLYLREEALVSLSPRIRSLADSVGTSARERYEFVLQRMDYDKTAPGWGRGDSERACAVGKGNCTDFHSLFMSLSRAKGVPAVFEMGYSMLPSGETEKAGGYHCWAWFYDEASASWVPVDISEADKHPEKTAYFFGQLDAERVLFSRGRDIRLPGMKAAPLNYLPAGAYVEVDGTPHQAVTRTITYPAQANHSAFSDASGR